MSSAGRLFSGEVEGVSSGAFGIISCASATAWGCQRNWTHLQTLNHSFETLLLLLVISMTSFCVESPFQLPFTPTIHHSNTSNGGGEACSSNSRRRRRREQTLRTYSEPHQMVRAL